MATKRTNETELRAALRRAIRQSGMTPYRVSKEAGVDRAVMVRFVNGDRGITLDTASRICAVLGLELKPTRRRKGR